MKLTETQKSIISDFLKEKRNEIIEIWKELVLIESSSREPENVRAVCMKLKEEFETAGLVCHTVEAEPNGPSLIGILGEDRPGKPIIFSGHYDTVFPKGTFGKTFEIEGDKAFGPGALDMKGGIVISLYVIKALEKLGFNQNPIKIIYSGDEEIGHKGSTGGKTIQDAAVGGLFAFNMETGRVDNCLCTGRKGSITFSIDVTGVSSHAGNDFHAGRNAIAEAAHKTIALQALTNHDVGTTVNVGVIKGGTVSNAIPGECTMEINIRVSNTNEQDRIMDEVQKIIDHVTVEGTSAKLRFSHIMPLFDTTNEGMRFYDFVCENAKANGFDVPGNVYLGGSSDASYLTMAGVPTICAFGVRGQWNHTKDEYALVESMYERIELITTIILNSGSF